jgi:hypothetical protein
MRFANYTALEMTNSPKDWLSSSEGAFVNSSTINGCSVGVVGVNTAWLSKDDNDRHRLTPGLNILQDALTSISTCELKIVLGHHPLDWLEDQQANSVRTILGNNNAIYLHGHLHEHETRFEDGGSGLFLCIRCGSSFQGRSEDKPKWINGLMWGDINIEQKRLLVQPLHWSSAHAEWKISGDAFPNQYRADSTDWWQFPLPGTVKLVPTPVKNKKTEAKIDDAGKETTIPIRNGWQLVDSGFLSARMAEGADQNVLQFFDGRPPNWRLALSPAVPRRSVVNTIYSRFKFLEDTTKPTVVNILGAGGEGKSAAFFQSVAKLIADDNWVSLWRFNDAQNIDVETIERLSKTHKKLVIAIDEAHSAAEWLPILLIRLNRLRQRNVHFLLCSRTIDWRAEADEMGIITRESDYQEISLGGLSKEDALQVINAWTAFGRDGLRNLQNMDPAKAAETLYEAAKDQDTDQEEGAFLGAMLRLRYGDSLKDKVRSILYRLKDIEAPGGTLLDAYALIAAMHNEGLRFLSLPVLAEALNCPQNEAQRKIVNPLADEAIAAGGGRFVLCRHKAIAQATVTVLKETNLYGEIDASFASLSRAAVIARQKGLYVPDLHKWDYALPEHFSSMGRKAIAIAAARRVCSLLILMTSA